MAPVMYADHFFALDNYASLVFSACEAAAMLTLVT